MSAQANVWLGRALVLIIIGLVVQLICVTKITPASFLVFAAFGVGPVVIGFAMIGYAMIHARRERDAGDPS